MGPYEQKEERGVLYSIFPDEITGWHYNKFQLYLVPR